MSLSAQKHKSSFVLFFFLFVSHAALTSTTPAVEISNIRVVLKNNKPRAYFLLKNSQPFLITIFGYLKVNNRLIGVSAEISSQSSIDLESQKKKYLRVDGRKPWQQGWNRTEVHLETWKKNHPEEIVARRVAFIFRPRTITPLSLVSVPALVDDFDGRFFFNRFG